jgi:ferritin-like metal-binding protein YciE
LPSPRITDFMTASTAASAAAVAMAVAALTSIWRTRAAPDLVLPQSRVRFSGQRICWPWTVSDKGASTSCFAHKCRNERFRSARSGNIRPAKRSRHSTKENVAMTKKAKKLDELFYDTLKDIYFAEKKILSTLPKMEKAAQAAQLKKAFAKHKTETEGHVARLEKVFAAIDKKPQAKTCDAIVGITDEGAEIMKDYKGSPALDAGLLAAAQAVEHYEISRYGTLKTWANELGLSDAVRLLEQTLDEEKKTDATLSEIAESAVNLEAEAA